MFDPEVLQILGLNLLAGKSPNFGENVGNAGLATLQYQRQREEDKFRREEQAFMKQQRELQLKALKRQDQEDEIMRQVLSVDPLAAARQSMPSLAPTNENASQLRSKVASLGAPNSREGMSLRLTQAADALQAQGLYKQAMAMREQAIKLQPEASGIEEVTGPNGERMLVTRFKDGSVKPLQYGPKAEKLNFQDAGGSILGLDPFTGQQRGQPIPKTPSFSDQVSAGNLAARLAELRDQGVPGLPGVPSLGAPGMPSAPPRPGVPTPAPQGLPPVPNNALPPSPFGMSPKQQRELALKREEAKIKPASGTEGERNAEGFLLRMNEASKVLDGLSRDNKGAELPGVVQTLTNNKLPTAGPYVSSPAQQMYRQAQEDWVRAKLRKESGAVIGDEEMAREIRVYFPQPGDSKDVIAQKRNARLVAEQAMSAAAGRRSATGASGNWSIEKE